MTCKSSEGEGARRGLCLQLPGSGSSAPGGFSSSCPCFPLPPSSNLTFRGGGRGGGVPACAARAVGRGLVSAEAGGAVLGSGRRAGKRAESPEPSYSRERRETMEGKRGLERCAGLTTAAPGRGPALRLNRRRGAGGCSAPLGPARRRSTRWPRLHQGRGGETRRQGRRLGGEKAQPGGLERLPPLAPVAHGLADVRPSWGPSPLAVELRPPGPTSLRADAGLPPALGLLPGGLGRRLCSQATGVRKARSGR